MCLSYLSSFPFPQLTHLFLSKLPYKILNLSFSILSFWHQVDPDHLLTRLMPSPSDCFCYLKYFLPQPILEPGWWYLKRMSLLFLPPQTGSPQYREWSVNSTYLTSPTPTWPPSDFPASLSVTSPQTRFTGPCLVWHQEKLPGSKPSVSACFVRP